MIFLEARMRGRVAATALTAMTLVAGAAMYAQQDGAPPPPPPQGATSGPQGGPGRMDPERRLEMLNRMLNLSEGQRDAIREIFADEQAKMQAQRASGQQMSPQDRRAAMMAMWQEQNVKIEALLTPEQKAKYEEMEAKMRERMQERQSEGAPPPPPPQS